MESWAKGNFGVIKDIRKDLLKTNDIVINLSKIKDREKQLDVIVSNQNNVLMMVLETATDYNKWKEKHLYDYIKNFLHSLNITEANEVLSKLYYYLEVYELAGVWWSDKLDDDMIEDPDRFPPSEIMYELLINNVYIPEYKNTKQFNMEMTSLIIRLEKRINKFRWLIKPIVFSPINPKSLLNYMEDMGSVVIKWVKTLDKWIIQKVWYKFALNEKINVKSENNFHFSFLVNSNDWTSVSREEFITHLWRREKTKDLKDGKNFFYDEKWSFQYIVCVWESMFRWSDEKDSEWFSETIDNYWFEVKVYAKRKRELKWDVGVEEIFAEMCYSLPWLTEEILDDLYQSYWRDAEWNIWYPSKPEIFDLSRIINAEETDKWKVLDFPSTWKSNLNIWESNNKSANYKFYKPEDIEYWINDIILEDNIKEILDGLLLDFKNVDFNKRNNWKLIWWIAFSWPSWTWKTTIVKVIWKESWAWVFVADPIQEDSYVWESAKNIDRVVSAAEDFIDDSLEKDGIWKIAIVYFDEAEMLFASREWWEQNHKWWMLKLILEKMDWFDTKYQWKLLFAFGTNRSDLFDNALMSRLWAHLVLDLPSEENRVKILDLHIEKKMKWMEIPMYEHSDLDLELIAKKMGKKSGRFINNLISYAHNAWLRKLVKDNKFTITTEMIVDAIPIIEKKEEEEGKVMWFIQK